VIGGQTAIISTLGVGRAASKHDAAVIEGVRVDCAARPSRHRSNGSSTSRSSCARQSRRSGLCAQAIATTPLRHEVGDHEVKEAAIVQSFVDWTIVRPPKLTNGRLTAAYRVGEDIRAVHCFR
jgi:hypothetical protein